MKSLILLFFFPLFAVSLANAGPADDSAKRGMADFARGKELYDKQDFAEARVWFKKSLSDFEDAAGAQVPNQRFTNEVAANARLLKRWVTATYCKERQKSFDVEVLRDLIGENRKAPSEGFHSSCSQFPDSPGVEAYVRERIKWVLAGSPGASPEAPAISPSEKDGSQAPSQPPTVKLEADAAVLAETRNCRSDQNNRDARSCFYEAMDRGGGTYNFRMNKDCPTEMKYLAVVFVREASGTCTRQVKIWTSQTPGKNVLVTSPGGAPEIKDAVIIRPDDDITACYIKRHNGRPCGAN